MEQKLQQNEVNCLLTIADLLFEIEVDTKEYMY